MPPFLSGQRILNRNDYPRGHIFSFVLKTKNIKSLLIVFICLIMDSELPKKNRKLDFYRPTFNESKIQLPINDTCKFKCSFCRTS